MNAAAAKCDALTKCKTNSCLLLIPFLLAGAILLGCGTSGSSGTTGVGSGGVVVTPMLVSGTNTLTFPSSGPAGYALQVSSSTAGSLGSVSATPVTIYVCQGAALSASTHSGVCPTASENSEPPASNTISVPYAQVTQSSAQITATATATSANGSVFNVSDVYSATAANMFTMTRTITVSSVSTGSTPDTGFNSQFALALSGTPVAIGTYHFMAPAVLYNQNALAPSTAIAANLSNTATNFYYWRETRSGLPMLIMQDDATGTTLSVARTGPAVSNQLVVKSGADETSANWLVDPSIQYGSLGIQKVVSGSATNPQPQIGVIYPAVEGDVTYIAGGANEWSRRSHPVYAGFSDSYAVTFDLETYKTAAGTANFNSALGASYRAFYNLEPPPIAPDHAAQLFSANISLSKQLFTNQGNGNGNVYPGLPFQESVDGSVTAYSYQMGFTGAQVSVGFQLLRNGVLNGDSTSTADGIAILNFWATQDPLAMASYGSQNLPLTWFEPNHSVQWSNVGCTVTATGSQRPIFLRELADGMESMVRAAIYARQTSAVGPQKTWEAFANQYGAWLLAHQDTSGTASNGSFQRWYNPTSGAACPSGASNYAQTPNATTFPIRFLVEMYFATGNTSYLNAARAAGAYALANVYPSMAFTGGILSNYQDRESGAQALHAALAMYDLEYQQSPSSAATAQWLQAAIVAANYLETWQYAYNIQITDTTANHAFAAYAFAGSQATSLSVLGSSTGDIYLSEESYDFFRLHLLSDDSTQQYLRFAEELEFNSKLTTQASAAGQNFGYLYDGFSTEAVTLTGMNFTSGAPLPWLSWLTGVQIDPQQQLQDVFGNQSILVLAGQNQTTLQQQNHEVYPAPGSIGWGK